MLFDEKFYVAALLKEIQYLSNLKSSKNFWKEIEKSVSKFFLTDMFLFLEKNSKMESLASQYFISEKIFSENTLNRLTKLTLEASKSGFISIETISYEQDTFNFIFLPITIERTIVGVIILSYKNCNKFSSEIINIFLTLLNAISSALERLKLWEEVDLHRNELQRIVKERTNDLEKSNIQLNRQIEIRKKIEKKLSESEAKYKSLFN